MPRRKRDVDGGISDLGGGRFRIRVTVGYDPDTGKQIRESHTLHGTRAEARTLKQRLTADRRGVNAYRLGRTPVDEWVRDYWLPDRTLRPTTRAGYDATIRNHVEPLFSDVTVAGMTVPFFRRRLAKVPSAGARLNVYKMVRSAMNLAVEEGVITVNPVRKKDRPELDPYEADIYTLDELAAILEFARGSEIEAGLIIASCCALRRSETCALDWTDLTLARDGERAIGAVQVTGSYHRVAGERYEAPTKTRRSVRTVPLPGFAVERLLELRGSARIGPLMVDATGQRMAPDGFTSRWRRLMKPCDGHTPPVRYAELKNLRHSNITALLDELEVSMHRASKWAGHGSERTTDARYNRSHRVSAVDQAAADALDAAIRGRSRVLTGPKRQGSRGEVSG